MSYFTKIGNSISVKSKEIVRNAKAVSETNSLSNIIKAEQQKIEANYRLIGKLYYQKFSNEPSEGFEEYFAAVKASIEKINEVNEEIKKIKGRNCCPNCGTKFNSESMFCSKCGARVKEETQAESDLPRCSNCGNVLIKGALFCNGCGAKVTAEPEDCHDENIVRSADESGNTGYVNNKGYSVHVDGEEINSRVGSPQNNIGRAGSDADLYSNNGKNAASGMNSDRNDRNSAENTVHSVNSSVNSNVNSYQGNENYTGSTGNPTQSVNSADNSSMHSYPDNGSNADSEINSSQSTNSNINSNIGSADNAGTANKFCHACGAEQDDEEAVFCIECGAKL